MKYLFYTLIIFLTFSNYTNANFELVSTLGISYDNSNVTVEYDKSRYLGLSLTEVNSLNIENLIYLQNGGILRKKGFGDRVFVVPGSIVNFNFLAKNNSEEVIQINKIRSYISRTTLNNGDLSRLGLVPTGIENGRKYIDINQSFELSPSEAISKPILSFKIPEKLILERELSQIKYTTFGVSLETKISVTNQSNYSLCDLVLKYKENQFPICVLPNEKFVFNTFDEYQHPIPEKLKVEGFSITDNNTYYESITTQALNPFDPTFDAKAFILMTSIGETDSILQSENNMTIVNIPYTKSKEPFVVDLEKNITIIPIENNSKLKKCRQGIISFEVTNLGNHIYNENLTLVDSGNFNSNIDYISMQNIMHGSKIIVDIPFNLDRRRKHKSHKDLFIFEFNGKTIEVPIEYNVRGKRFEVL